MTRRNPLPNRLAPRRRQTGEAPLMVAVALILLTAAVLFGRRFAPPAEVTAAVPEASAAVELTTPAATELATAPAATELPAETAPATPVFDSAFRHPDPLLETLPMSAPPMEMETVLEPEPAPVATAGNEATRVAALPEPTAETTTAEPAEREEAPQAVQQPVYPYGGYYPPPPYWQPPHPYYAR